MLGALVDAIVASLPIIFCCSFCILRQITFWACFGVVAFSLLANPALTPKSGNRRVQCARCSSACYIRSCGASGHNSTKR